MPWTDSSNNVNANFLLHIPDFRMSYNNIVFHKVKIGVSVLSMNLYSCLARGWTFISYIYYDFI